MSDILGQLTPLEIVLLLLLLAGLFFILYLAGGIINSILNRRKAKIAADDAAALQENPAEIPAEETAPEPEPERPLDERGMLQKREEELRKRETRLKEERMKELEQREKFVISRSQPAEVNGGPGFESEVDDTIAERRRILEFIKNAEDRYAKAELSDQNFRKIVSDYQQQLIELDVKMRKQREGKPL